MAEQIKMDDHATYAHDIDFESICLAYKSVFSKKFTDIYHIDPELKNRQLVSLLAFGCLVKDIDHLCNGFVSPDDNFPYLHDYLQTRLYDLIFGKKGFPLIPQEEFKLFAIGRTIPEAFWRIRLLFRFYWEMLYLEFWMAILV